LIINTFSYLWSTRAVDALAELIDHGYTAFEIPISSPHCWPDELDAAERTGTRRRLDRSGASIRSLNAGGYDLNLASPAASMRRKSIEHISAVIDLAAEWGAREVVVSPGTRRPMISPTLEQVHGWMYDSLEELIPIARRSGQRLLFENTPYCFAPTIGDLARIIETVDDDALKIVYDAANAAFIEEDPVAGLLEHADTIALMHVSDTGTETWGHDPIGTGVIDWAALGAAVDATIGTDAVVLEVIREENPLFEFDAAMTELRSRNWMIPSVGTSTLVSTTKENN
jgi:sugar phosphate isomerase/epimerase